MPGSVTGPMTGGSSSWKPCAVRKARVAASIRLCTRRVARVGSAIRCWSGEDGNEGATRPSDSAMVLVMVLPPGCAADGLPGDGLPGEAGSGLRAGE